MDFPNSELWNYSTQIWALPEVEANCLALQNDFDANINMLFYCCWVGSKNLCLSDDDLQILIDTIQPWQTIIKPLRESRKMMQQQAIAMPADLKDNTINNMSEMELNAEHMAQIALEKVLKPSDIAACNKSNETQNNSVACSLKNAQAYLNTLDNISSEDEIMLLINPFLSAIFQDEEAVQMAMMELA